MSSFAQLRAALREWPAISIGSAPLPEYPYERLRRALCGPVGAADLACLIRHALRREGAFYGNATTRITVPTKPPFPSRQQWLEHGCIVREVSDNAFEVEALPWEPRWLKRLCVREEVAKPFQAVEEEQQRFAHNRRVPSDPALQIYFKLPDYLSSAQAETIRSVLLSPSGSVHLVVLPTGGGKSLVGLCASLLGPTEGGLSIFVVPTIALAHDQVKSARLLRPHDAIDAWESGLSSEDKAALRVRIQSGAQRLLFAAPESIVGSLAKDLIGLADRGALRAFVIDEAHLVGQWGASFRPEFQSMSAFWRFLQRSCPPDRRFRTLLMTATLTAETFGDLNSFFGPLGPGQTLATVQLRPEPDYFQAPCDSELEKIERTLEALRYGPRPAILYVTKKDDARAWHARCVAQGWLRTGIVHGETSSVDRERAIRAWRDNDLDLMVATSAFGLGMDKGDVRLVVHACVPETVDRFYQEVGRGGRDGLASVSITVWTPDDYRMGKRMSQAMLISGELGLERWRTMWSSRVQSEGDTLLLNLRAVRPDLNWDSEDNAKWNLRTLLLLARSGVLRILYRPLPDLPRLTGETDETFGARRRQQREEHFAFCPVQLIGNYNPLTETAWQELVEPDRSDTLRQGEANWRRMSDILRGRRPLPEVLRKVYAVPAAGIYSVGLDNTDAVGTPPITPNNVILASLRQAVTGQPPVPLVTYRAIDSKNQGRLVVETLVRLAVLGIREFGLPHGWAGSLRWFQSVNNPIEQLLRRSPERFIIVRELDDQDPLIHGHLPVPRVSLLGPDATGAPIPEHLFLLNRPLHLILVPGDTRDRQSPWRTVDDGPHLRLEDFYRLLIQ